MLEINQLQKKIGKSEVKSLIVAAGLGSRLKKHTEKKQLNIILIKIIIHQINLKCFNWLI